VTCPSGWSCKTYTCYTSGGGGGGGAPAEITPKPISAGGTGVFGYTDPLLSIVNVSVTVNRSVTYAKITVSKSTISPGSVAIGAPGYVYQYITITKTGINDSDITHVKIVFKVEKSWIAANNIDSSSIKMYKYIDGSWVAQPTTKIGEDSAYIYFEATSTGLSYFAVSATKRTTLTFWQVVTYIDNYYAGQITFWTLLNYISNYYSG
jgi:PGF-pre-PGF domain-containing protein